MGQQNPKEYIGSTWTGTFVGFVLLHIPSAESRAWHTVDAQEMFAE